MFPVMSTRKLLPYYATIFVFITIYAITMLLPDHALGLHARPGWSNTGRVTLHAHIFIDGLLGVLLILNLLEMFSTNNDVFVVRLLKTIFTILLVYLGCGIVFYCLHSHVWNMFYADKISPARVYLATILCGAAVALTTLDIVKVLLLQMIERTRIHERIPTWLRFEPEIEY